MHWMHGKRTYVFVPVCGSFDKPLIHMLRQCSHGRQEITSSTIFAVSLYIYIYLSIGRIRACMLLQVANLTFGDLLAHITSNRETYCPQNNWEYEAEGNSEKKKRPAAYITYLMQHTPTLRRPYEKEYVAPLSFDPSFRSRMLETLGNSFIPLQF